jgi:hypothetical protein
VRPGYVTAGFVLLALVVGFLIGYLLWDPDPVKSGEATKTVTVEKTIPGPERTVERTVPGPERTIFKKKPGQTIWIIVCGERTQRVVGDKPIQECQLPDTSGEVRK